MNKLGKFLYAKYRAFAPISCLESPRSDVLRGWQRWRWLTQQRRAGHLIDPSVEIRCRSLVRERLILAVGATLDRGVIVWISDEADAMACIILGQNVYVGPYVYIGSCHRLSIGDHSLIGAHSYLITVNHRTDHPSLPIAQQGFRGGDIKIGCNVWLGCHVTILPGVTIGDRAIVGAGAVVTKDIPAGEIWAGVPARFIKHVAPSKPCVDVSN